MEERMKQIMKKSLKRIIAWAILIPFLGFILGGCVYVIVVGDSKKRDKEWESVPYAAGEYMKGITVNEDGTFSEGISAEDLWEKMKENGSPVEEYLDSPEELMKLMKAEMITKYPNLNPEEEINWDEIMKGNSTILQGIIKFKRRDSENNTSNLKYASPEQFQSYIDEYNSSGSETAKQNALSHFTLKKNSVITNSGYLETIDGVDMRVITESGIVTFYNGDGSAQEGGHYNRFGQELEDGMCAVRGLREMGLVDDHSVIYIETQETGNSSFANGKFFYICDTGGGLAGAHVDVYANVPKPDLSKSPYGKSTQAKISLVENNVSWEEYLQKYHNKTLNKDNTSNKETTNPDKSDTNKTNNGTKIATATVTPVNGDGYSQIYTSSAGITYKEYKQSVSGGGSYANTPYWDGTIATSGCGPTSIAILASGLTNFNKNPGDIGAEIMQFASETNPYNVKRELDSLGLLAEVVEPSAEKIQESLRNGKVMAVSLGHKGQSIFSDDYHYVAVVDINTDGQVYVINPGSKSGGESGWYDVSAIMNDCNKLIIVDAGASGIAYSQTNTSTSAPAYTAVIATWKQIDTIITTDDPNVETRPEGLENHQYIMSTTNINYEEMVKKYTMPFDLLWALLVTGEDKDFVLELADLVYNSDIEITVHDNLTVDTNVDHWYYTEQSKAIVNGEIIGHYSYIRGDEENRNSLSRSISNDVHDPDPSQTEDYQTIKTVVTHTNTVNTLLTKANVWIVDYQNEYTYQAETDSKLQSDTVTQADQKDYSEEATREGVTYSCQQIESAKEYLRTRGRNLIKVNKDENPDRESALTMIEENLDVKYYSKYVNIRDEVSYSTTTQKYIEGVPSLIEKVDKETEPNFVTIFNKQSHRQARSAIRDIDDWLTEDILGDNESTADIADLIRYLIHKNPNQNIEEEITYDFSEFDPKNFKNVTQGAGTANIIGSSIEVANGTAAQKLQYLFPNGTPTTEAEADQYMTTIEIPITTKAGVKTTSKLTVHKLVAKDVLEVFQAAQDAGFKVYEADAYCFRYMNNGDAVKKLSHHSYGIAIDINVEENYSHEGSKIYAGDHWEPSTDEYSIPSNGILVQAFKAKGWEWGGDWPGNYQDYMHFSFTGN